MTGAVGKFDPRQKRKTVVYTQKAKETEVWVSGAEIQTLAVDTRTAVWVSAAEKTQKLGNFLKSLEGSQRQLCIKTRPLLTKTSKTSTCLKPVKESLKAKSKTRRNMLLPNSHHKQLSRPVMTPLLWILETNIQTTISDRQTRTLKLM